MVSMSGIPAGITPLDDIITEGKEMVRISDKPIQNTLLDRLIVYIVTYMRSIFSYEKARTRPSE